MYVLPHTRGIDCQGNNSLRPKGFKKTADFLLFMFIFFRRVWYGNVQAEVAARGLARRMRRSQTTAKTKHTEEEEHWIEQNKTPILFLIQTRAWHGRGYRVVWKIMNPFPPTENVTMSRTKNLKFAGHGISKGLEHKKKDRQKTWKHQVARVIGLAI